jgi:type IV pilus assembly protein PilW
MRIRTRQAGFTLVEMMVAMAIFIGVSIVVFTTLAKSEGQKRTTTSINDITQEGAFSVFELGAFLRSAGSGFGQDYLQAYGCKIVAVRSTQQILPATAAFPAPFASIGQTQRLAPAIIYQGASQAGSDVIAVMAGAAGFEQTGQQLISVPTATSLNPSQSSTVNPNDMLLITDASGTSMHDCLVEQVSSTYTSGSLPITLAGTYYTAGLSSGTQLNSFSVSGNYVNIGTLSASANNSPSFLLFGVGPSPTSSGTATNYSLFSYDLLQTAGATTATPFADSVIVMRALYGVDTSTTADGVIDSWVDPGSATAGYDPTTLLNGTPASADKLRRIKAIRLGLIMRADIAEKATVTTAAPTLFSDLGAALTYTLPGTATAPAPVFNGKYRYRTLESTIPLRNNYLIGN